MSAHSPDPPDMNWDNQIVSARGQDFNAFYKPATVNGPLFIFHHGAASSASTFAVLAMDIEQRLPDCGLLAYDARGHGRTKSEPKSEESIPDLSIDTLLADFIAIVSTFDLTSAGLILVGHSMGGTVVSKVCSQSLLQNVKGLIVIDAVEEYAQQSLHSMPSLVASWPESFASLNEAVAWSLRHLLKNKDSANISIPAILKRESGSYVFCLDLLESSPYWNTWFAGLDDAFLASPCARLLILAGTGRLDKKLMVGQMQGKYQLVVLSGCNHFVHEDAPEKVTLTLVDFWERVNTKLVPKFGSFRT